jgi:hypothetical protein
VPYVRSSRIAGETTYTLPKMLGLAFTGITAFSSAPLRLIALLGLVSSIVSLAFAAWVIAAVLIEPDKVVPGWASILLSVSVFASVQIFCASIIGEYVARIYDEVKGRPRFIVEKRSEDVFAEGQKEPAVAEDEVRLSAYGFGG